VSRYVRAASEVNDAYDACEGVRPAGPSAINRTSPTARLPRLADQDTKTAGGWLPLRL
jgi:hypothetical protein